MLTRGFLLAQGERITTEPRIWERRKKSMADRGAVGFKAPKPLSQISNRNDAQKRVRMTQETYEDDVGNHDYLEEDVHLDDLDIPFSNVDNYAGGDEGDGGKGDAKPLQVQIAELEVEILTAKRALLQTQSTRQMPSIGGAVAERDVALRSHASEQRSRRRKISKQLQDEVVVREQSGIKRYSVEVDMKGNPCGQNRSLWLTCLRGHSQDVDFSEDNYNAHKTSMLLNIKQRVDNTFEYEGGLGRVTEEAFHAILKGQLKIKRYQLKKALQAGKPKPKHIRQDHWLNLCRLISEDCKLKEAERLKSNRSQLKRPSVVGRCEEDLTTNLVIFLPMNFLCEYVFFNSSYQYVKISNARL